jgi:hypothetical protein
LLDASATHLEIKLPYLRHTIQNNKHVVKKIHESTKLLVGQVGNVGSFEPVNSEIAIGMYAACKPLILCFKILNFETGLEPHLL